MDVPQEPYWWQWPTILSVDAPVVTVVWLALIGRSLDVPLGWPRFVVLGLSVWLAYAADRWIEGWRLPRRALRTPRHRFYQHWRWTMLSIWIAGLGTDIVVAAVYLPASEIATGLVLTSAVAMYLLSHQLVHRHSRWRAPKEMCIAALLTGGAAVSLGDAAGLIGTAAPLALFGALCFVNCVLISAWERDVDRAHGQSSLALESSRVSALIPWTPWMLVAAGLVLLFAGGAGTRIVAGCAAASAVALAVIDRLERRTGWPLAHVLADAALLTPAVALLWRR